MTSNTVFDKWVDGLSSEITVADAARSALQNRLQAVLHFLPLAAERSDQNLEYVHLLRVWSRRSLAVFNLYNRILPKKKWRCLRKKLKKIRDVASDARDLDVLLSQTVDEGTWESKAFAVGVWRRRAKAQRPIQRCCDRMRRRSRLVKLLMKLLEDISKKGEVTPLIGNWAQDALRRVVEHFHHAFPTDTNDLCAMHRFRTKVKDVRYAIELLAPAFPTELKDCEYPLIEDLQESLGTINDHAVAIFKLSEWIAMCHNRFDRRLLKKRRAHESKQLTLSLEGFQKRWTHGVLTQLLASLSRRLNGHSRTDLRGIEGRGAGDR